MFCILYTFYKINSSVIFSIKTIKFDGILKTSNVQNCY